MMHPSPPYPKEQFRPILTVWGIQQENQIREIRSRRFAKIRRCQRSRFWPQSCKTIGFVRTDPILNLRFIRFSLRGDAVVSDLYLRDPAQHREHPTSAELLTKLQIGCGQLQTQL